MMDIATKFLCVLDLIVALASTLECLNVYSG